MKAVQEYDNREPGSVKSEAEQLRDAYVDAHQAPVDGGDRPAGKATD